MRPFDQIPTLERVTALDAPAGVLTALSRLVSKPDGLRRILAGEPFGHSAHPMLVQIPIGAWVSAGWLDCLPRTEKSAAVLTGVGIDAHRRPALRRHRARLAHPPRRPPASTGRRREPLLTDRLRSRSAPVRLAAGRRSGRPSCSTPSHRCSPAEATGRVSAWSKATPCCRPCTATPDCSASAARDHLFLHYLLRPT